MRRMLLRRTSVTPPFPPEAFVLTVKSDNTGTSSNDQFTIPTNGDLSQNYDVETSDGYTATGLSGNHTITFPSGAGTHQVYITGNFLNIRFNNGGDKLKVLSVDQWGDIAWDSFNGAFRGCANLTANYTDVPDTSAVLSLNMTFRDCTLWNGSINDWDTSSVNDMFYTFLNCINYNQPMNGLDVSSVANMRGVIRGCTLFNQPLNLWVTSSASDMREVFLNAISFDQDISMWDISSLTNAANFLQGATLSTVNYDALLVGWEANLQGTYPAGAGYTATITVNFGSSTYTLASAAATARASLIITFGWTISDGGGV